MTAGRSPLANGQTTQVPNSRFKLEKWLKIGRMPASKCYPSLPLIAYS